MGAKDPKAKKLVIDNAVVEPKTKIRLADKIGARRAKLILDDVKELEKLRAELEADRLK